MFALKDQDAKITNVNPRSELHGEEYKLACDISFQITTSNAILDDFAPHLKETLFGTVEDSDQGEIDMQDSSYLPELKFREMGKIPWSYKGAGYRVVIPVGVTGDKDIVFIEASIDKFVFELKQGGSVVTTFKVIVHPEAEEIGQLCEFIQQDVDLTLEPPSPEQAFQQDLEEISEEIDGVVFDT